MATDPHHPFFRRGTIVIMAVLATASGLGTAAGRAGASTAPRAPTCTASSHSKGTTCIPPTPSGLTASAVTPTGATLTWSPAPGATGYSVFASGHMLKGTATARFTDTSRIPGSGTAYTVTARDAMGTSRPTAPIVVTTLPQVPTGLTANPGDGQIALAWNVAAGATGYTVFSGSGAVATTTSPSSQLTGLTDGTTYTLTVAATGTAGPSAHSAVALATPMPPLPGAPTALMGTDVTASGATLSWDPVPGATDYGVDAQGVQVGATSATTYTDTTTAPGSTVTYSVAAVNLSGSGPTAMVDVVTLPAAPGAPSTSGATASGATLSWAPVTGATGYVVDAQGAQVATTTATTYTDTSAPSGSDITYTVAAFDVSGVGAPSAPVTVTTVPAAPGGLAASAVTAGGATLVWNPVTGATSYLVSVGGVVIGTSTTTTYTDGSAPAGSGITYSVAAVNVSGVGAPSAPVTVTTVPAAPGGLAASAVTAGGATLVWNPVTGATSYLVSVGGVVIGTSTTTTYTDVSAPAGSGITYSVAAVDISGTGAPSAPVTVTTVPAAPGGLAASAVTAGGATLVWNPVAGATSYLVYAQNILVATTASPTYTDAASPSGSAVSYVVIAADASGEGATSVQVTVTTLPAAPTGLTPTAVTASGATLTWNPVAGATGYTLDLGGSPITTTSSTTATDSGEAPGSTLVYTVTASDATGASAPSAPVQVVLVPGPPVGVVAYPADSALSVRWPAVPGATGYSVNVSGRPTVLVIGTAATVGGLTDGTTYSVTVAATDAAGTSVASAPATGMPAAPTVPTSAFSLLNMEGVDTHSSYGTTPYGNAAQTESLLGQLGVRHIRDSLAYGSSGTQKGQIAFFNALHARGIGVDLVMTPSGSTGDLAGRVAAVGSSLSSDVDGIEGPNELDNTGQPNWAVQDIAYQQALHAAVRATPSLGSVPLVGPSLDSNLALLGGNREFLTLGNLSASLDLGNIHDYPGGRVPTWNMGATLAAEQSVSGSKSVWVTETGYHDAVDAPGNFDVSDTTAAAYLPRLLLEWHQRGAGRVNLYELYDESPDPGQTNYQNHFGLVGYNGVPKPQFTAVQNFNTLLQDTSGAFTLSPLTYSVSSGSGTVSSMLLEKSTGQYVLYLWQNVSVSNTATNPPSPVSVPPTPVTVTLGTPASSITEYRPSLSATPQAATTGTATFTVGLQGDATALVIQP
jgi:hypothetical protein